MKLKLAGLLVFSQSAQAVNRVDTENYHKYFCYDNLFTPIAEVAADAVVVDSEIMMATRMNKINWEYSRYCRTQLDYEKAFERAKSALNQDPIECCSTDFFSPETCLWKTGMEYATNCERVRDDKKDPANHAAWNAVMATHEPCRIQRRP